ncbi:uncharacterized protein LOC141910141 isoform X2 [Tubulanus polymorphus]|uniref:uncharacterized protein LOC141910141 isoform X2 n=1 Tax=Tubulanus polymorphus TaxID=672921 RepID=UPI003DA3E181
MSKLLALMFVCGLAVHAHAFIAGVRQSMDAANGISKRTAEFTEAKRDIQDRDKTVSVEESAEKRDADCCYGSQEEDAGSVKRIANSQPALEAGKRNPDKTVSVEESAEKRDADCCYGSQEEDAGSVKRIANSQPALEAGKRNPDKTVSVEESAEKRDADCCYGSQEEDAGSVKRIANSQPALEAGKRNPDKTVSVEESAEKRDADCCYGSQEEDAGSVKRIANSQPALEAGKRNPSSTEDESAKLFKRIAESLQASFQSENNDDEKQEKRSVDKTDSGEENAEKRDADCCIGSQEEEGVGSVKRIADSQPASSLEAGKRKPDPALEKILEGAVADSNDQAADSAVVADKRVCRGYGQRCFRWTNDRCCANLFCHRPHANSNGTCAACKRANTPCWKDFECCRNMVCRRPRANRFGRCA